MPLTLRRSLAGLAATGLVVGGSLGFVSVAGATPPPAPSVPEGTIALHNATAASGSDCPDTTNAYWHFVFAPNDGSASFTSITLELATQPSGSEVLTFDGAAIIDNGGQTDNVFVAVPAGHSITDLRTGDHSYAYYDGETPGKFNLSHVCEGTVPSTTTTQAPTTTTTQAPTTTTTTQAPTTTTTQAPTTTTTTQAPTTTTTTPQAPTTTTTQAPTTTTSSTVAPTTSTVGTSSTTVRPSIQAEVLGTVQTEAVGSVQTSGELPYTGSNTAGLVLAGMSVLTGGLILALLARTKAKAAPRA